MSTAENKLEPITEYFWEGKNKKRFFADKEQGTIVQERNGHFSEYGKIEYFREPYLNTPLDKMKTLQGRQVKTFSVNYMKEL